MEIGNTLRKWNILYISYYAGSSIEVNLKAMYAHSEKKKWTYSECYKQQEVYAHQPDSTLLMRVFSAWRMA